MTNEQLAKIKEAAAKATPGPWRVGPVDDTRVEDAAGNEVAQIDGDYNQPDTWPQMEANAAFIAAARTALPELLAEVTRITREQQEERADWYRFGTFMSQFDLGDKDGGTDAVVDSWIERITRLEAAEARALSAYNEGIEAAAKALQAMNPEYNDGPSMHVENMTLGRAIIAIRALKKPATDEAAGKSGE